MRKELRLQIVGLTLYLSSEPFDSATSTNEITVNIHTLEEKLADWVAGEMSNAADTAEKRILNATLAAMESIIASRNGVAVRS